MKTPIDIEELGDLFYDKFNHLPLSNNNDEWGNAFGIFRAGYEAAQPKWISVEELAEDDSDFSAWFVDINDGKIELITVTDEINFLSLKHNYTHLSIIDKPSPPKTTDNDNP